MNDLCGATESWCELLLVNDSAGAAAAKERADFYRKSADRLNEAIRDRLAEMLKEGDGEEDEDEDEKEWCEKHERVMWKNGMKCGGCLDDEDEWNCGWEDIYSQTSLCCDWVWGNKPFEGNGVFYQTFGGGPSGGYVCANEARNEVWRVYRNFGTPYKFTLEKGYVLDLLPNQTPPKCKLRKVAAEEDGAGDAP